ncbi:hydrogenase expression/formation protein HypE [Telmatocola sphagniphila]|uniref:Hydrogenase expression/formation protein HypE n=1 Tax=Telmatocola sphagniphila TaxID=1123043 RepID=A0A8E6EYK2_9BACT|nr:hydrogenase expression/formation protein HypE [Telmatocola sphagniphila]QVL32456.1 hydrogenase expression/formation protein HypE [Telmatocola sphagniphila]
MPGLNSEGWTCPLPLRDYPRIVLGHGGGGKLTSELIENLFLPAFDNAALTSLGDATVLPNIGGRLAVTTDSYVVRPLFFPGGCIGDLAVHGTVNDLAMAGARPLYLTAAFILEEGLLLSTLGQIVRAMARSAREAGVKIICGDTKVVERGHGDGCFITTTGVGVVPEEIVFGPDQVKEGDLVVVSGTLGNHGVAILSVREGLDFGTTIESDTAPLYSLVVQMLASGASLRMMRDPTRGGLAATLNEIVGRMEFGIEIEESKVPLDSQVQAACELLGLDPFQVANEGKLVAVVAEEKSEELLQFMRQHPLGQKAAVIGRVTREYPGLVVAKTSLGGRRVISMPMGEQLPRIC